MFFLFFIIVLSFIIIFFWWVLVSICYHFFSAWRTTFNISYETDLLAMSSLSLYLSGDAFVSPSILKDCLLG